MEHINHFEHLGDVGICAKRVRCTADLSGCDGLVLPGGESTTMTLIAKQSDLWDALKQWVHDGRPTWGTCAGLILLGASVSNAKAGQDFLGGLDVHVARNAFGAQLASFEGPLHMSEDHMDGWNAVQSRHTPASQPSPRTQHPTSSSAPRRTVTSSFEAAIAGVCIPPSTRRNTSTGAEDVATANTGIFIRAPAILHVGKGATVLATVQPPPPKGTCAVASLPITTEDHSTSSQERVIVAVAASCGDGELPVLLGTAFHPELTDCFAWHAYFAAMVQAYHAKHQTAADNTDSLHSNGAATSA